MTDPTASETAAPGWYPDASGGRRWWDGTRWTEHTAPAASATLQRTPLPEGTRVDGLWVWIVSLGFFVTCIPLFFFDMNDYLRAVMAAELSRDTSGLAGAMTGYVAFVVISSLLSFAVWGLTVFAAYRDVKQLEGVGVVRPFHWAFAFIPYPIVYLIGRHVVLRKVVRTAGWPLWAHIAGNVIVVIASFVWALVLVQVMLTEMTGYVALVR